MTQETYPTPEEKPSPKERGYPWATVKEFHKHYSESLLEYLHSVNDPRWGKQHIGDLSASASNFADVWWAIYGNIHDHYRHDRE